MKKFDRLDEPEILPSYVKRYTLYHKDGNTSVTIDDNNYTNENDFNEDTGYNKYLNPYLLSEKQFSLDDEEHDSIYEIEYQINNIIDDICAFESWPYNTFEEPINNLEHFRVALIDGEDKGYYTNELISDIENKLLIASPVDLNLLLERKNEILNNE